MIVVSNTTPIISLSSIGQIDLLQKLFKKVIIAKAVYLEIKSKKSYGYNEVDKDYFEVKEIIGTNYLNFLLNEMDIGEAETILLAKEIKADLLIIDERIGFDFANMQDIVSIGTLSVLKLAKEKCIIDKIKPLLDEMIKKGRWYSKNIYDQFLKNVNE
jgi:predicted nucleic acid-binding protein